MGCDGYPGMGASVDIVSIHAPAWGATMSIRRRLRYCSFQSTHPHGVRPFNADDDITIKTVSIHAPAWGATRYVPDVFPC